MNGTTADPGGIAFKSTMGKVERIRLCVGALLKKGAAYIDGPVMSEVAVIKLRQQRLFTQAATAERPSFPTGIVRKGAVANVEIGFLFGVGVG